MLFLMRKCTQRLFLMVILLRSSSSAALLCSHFRECYIFYYIYSNILLINDVLVRPPTTSSHVPVCVTAECMHTVNTPKLAHLTIRIRPLNSSKNTLPLTLNQVLLVNGTTASCWFIRAIQHQQAWPHLTCISTHPWGHGWAQVHVLLTLGSSRENDNCVCLKLATTVELHCAPLCARCKIRPFVFRTVVQTKRALQHYLGLLKLWHFLSTGTFQLIKIMSGSSLNNIRFPLPQPGPSVQQSMFGNMPHFDV